MVSPEQAGSRQLLVASAEQAGNVPASPWRGAAAWSAPCASMPLESPGAMGFGSKEVEKRAPTAVGLLRLLEDVLWVVLPPRIIAFYRCWAIILPAFGGLGKTL